VSLCKRIGPVHTQTLVKRPVGRLEQMRDYEALMDRVKVLQSQGYSTPKMAEILNSEGWVPPKQRGTYNTSMVHSLLNRQGISLGTPKQQYTTGIPREADEWSVCSATITLSGRRQLS